MEKSVKDYGGLILFCLFIVLSVLIVNERFEYLNKINNSNNLYALKN